MTHLDELYAQYRSEAGRVLPDVLPYEGRPTKCRRADCQSGGEGIVLVVHLAIQAEGQVYKLTVCSGFAISVDSAAARPDSDVVVTCAHTLEEIQRSSASVAQSVSYVLTSDGSTARPVNRIIASTPRSDLLVLQVHRPETSAPLSTLPLSPYPVPIGHPVLTHLFASPHVPFIQRSKAKLSQGASAEIVDQGDVESSVSWLGGNAWRRWGKGVMLGYRSHIGQDVEVQIHCAAMYAVSDCFSYAIAGRNHLSAALHPDLNPPYAGLLGRSACRRRIRRGDWYDQRKAHGQSDRRRTGLGQRSRASVRSGSGRTDPRRNADQKWISRCLLCQASLRLRQDTDYRIYAIDQQRAMLSTPQGCEKPRSTVVQLEHETVGLRQIDLCCAIRHTVSTNQNLCSGQLTTLLQNIRVVSHPSVKRLAKKGIRCCNPDNQRPVTAFRRQSAHFR